MTTYLLNPSGGVYRYREESGLEFFVLDSLSWRTCTQQEFDHLDGWLDPVPLDTLPEEVIRVESALS